MNISTFVFCPYGRSGSSIGNNVNIFNPWNWNNSIKVKPFPSFLSVSYVRRFSSDSTQILPPPLPFVPYFCYQLQKPFILVLY